MVIAYRDESCVFVRFVAASATEPYPVTSCLRALQSKAFQDDFETLKELLIDTNINGTNGLNHRSDNTRVVMIHLRIHADKFEDYVCEEQSL
jgi:hypothetical protein